MGNWTLTAKRIHLKGPINLLRTILRAAVEVGDLESLPAFPKLFKESKKLPDAPTTEEVEAMLAHSTGWLHTAIALTAHAGLRMGEVRALEVQDVDLKNGCVNIRRAFSENTLDTPKSGHERVVPLTPELQRVLTEAVRSKLPRARVILSRLGLTPSRQNTLSTMKEMLQRNDLKTRSFHSLRHYFCSTLVRRGANLEAVRLLAGHAGLDVTQRYVHATGADLQDAIGKFSGN